MATPTAPARLTAAEYLELPEQDQRTELIDGELVVTASAVPRHQRVAFHVMLALEDWARRNGGEVFPGPIDVYIDDRNVLAPDVVFVLDEHRDHVGERYLDPAPDLVVEVSSPSTRRRVLGRKRELYEQARVPEYWFVDLPAEMVMVHRLREEGYVAADHYRRGTEVTSQALPGLVVAVDELLAP